jgi:glucose-fructose oxidoreductase
MRILRDGDIGKLKMIGTDNGRPSDPDDAADQWRLDAELSGGGALFDIGIYGINARYLANEEPVEVRAWTSTDRDDPRFRETKDVVAWQLRVPSGAIANGSTSFSYAESSRLQVVGNKGRLVLDPATNLSRAEADDPHATRRARAADQAGQPVRP